MNFYSLKRLFLMSAITTIFIGTYIPAFANTEQTQLIPIEKKLAALEASLDDGKIGVLAINTANKQQIQYRASEHFPIQSTFKVMAVSAILKRSMADKHLLQQKMTYTKKDLVSWSPITEKHLTKEFGTWLQLQTPDNHFIILSVREYVYLYSQYFEFDM